MNRALRRRILVESARLAGELQAFFETLDADPPDLLGRTFPIEDPELRAPAGGRTVPRSPVTGRPIDEQAPFSAGRRGLEKLMRAGLKAALEDDELLDLQTVVLVAVRPAILIRDGRFLPPPPPWEFLEKSRAAIDAVARSVGRVQVTPTTEVVPFAGTGFFVAPDLVMTNRHVAEAFGGVVNGSFAFVPGMASAVDLARNPDADPAPELAVREVVTHPTLDLALLRVDLEAGGGAAEVRPLTLAADPPPAPEPGRPHHVYVVGYPTRDQAHSEALLAELLGGAFGVKRLQPGVIMEVVEQKPLFKHDCSTLRGSSGSCVVDLDTHRVIGLHAAGKLLKFNEAVALWRLVDDPVLEGVTFG